MPGYLKQATAAQSRAIGPFVDDTDFKTAETGLTIANTDIKLIVNGAASANKNSGGGTHRANGVYGITFDATDTATVGEMQVSVVVAGALPVFDKFFVLEEAVYDALFGASAAGYQVPIWSSAGATVSLSATTVATVSTLTGHTPQTGDSYALANGANGFVALKADTAAILTDTAEIGAAGAGLTAVPWNAAWDAEVQSEVADGLAAFWTSPATLVDLVWDEAIAGHAGAGSTGEALAGATAPSAAAVADAVWDEAISGHLSAGSTGEALNAAGAAGDPWTTTLPGAYGAGSAGYIIGTNINATISSRASQTSVDTIDGIVDSILVDTAEIGAAGAGLTALATAAALATVDSNVDAILVDTNELQTDWANGGRLDLILDARASQTTADAIEADTQDIQSRIPAALSGGNMTVDVLALNGDTTSAANIAKTTRAIARGTASGTPTTTSIPTSSIAPAVTVADQLKGRILVWDADTTTAALRGQATDITANTSGGVLTVTALTTAPVSGDTFSVT